MTIRRGEIYRWTGGDSTYVRVLIISSDEVNEVAWPIAAPISRTGPASIFLPALAETDPVSGVVALSRLGAVDPTKLEGPDGMITGQTFGRVSEGIAALFGI